MSITAPGSTTHSFYPPHINNDTSASERTSRTKRGIADTSKRWPDGIVTVALDLKDQKSKALVVDALREWAHHTPGLQFRVVDGKEGDIRISDDEGFNGNWSAIGTDAKKIPLHEPTMHLNRSDDSKGFRRTALHEIGHALGLEHEHQHPEHDINWKESSVYKAFEQDDNWDEEDVYNNLFKLPTGNDLLITSYDRRSIMHYPIHPSATKDSRGVPANDSLSEGDKEIIRKLYTPKRFRG
jgi:hypothetical protein